MDFLVDDTCDVLDLFHKVFSTINMVWGFTYQGFKDLGKFLSHTIGDRTTTGHDRL